MGMRPQPTALGGPTHCFRLAVLVQEPVLPRTVSASTQPARLRTHTPATHMCQATLPQELGGDLPAVQLLESAGQPCPSLRPCDAGSARASLSSRGRSLSMTRTHRDPVRPTLM